MNKEEFIKWFYSQSLYWPTPDMVYNKLIIQQPLDEKDQIIDNLKQQISKLTNFGMKSKDFFEEKLKYKNDLIEDWQQEVCRLRDELKEKDELIEYWRKQAEGGQEYYELKPKL